jgi:hypothetical protein
MPIETPFDAVLSQFATRLAQMKTFIDAIPTIKDDPEVRRFGFQWLLVAYSAFVQGLLESFLFFAALFQHQEFRGFLKQRSTDAKHRKELDRQTDAQLARYARRSCSFERSGKKLRDYASFLFNAPLFPDADNERLVTDLFKVRNLIVHHGGLPEQQHAEDIQTPGLIVATNKVGQHQFYRLSLDAQQLVNFMAAGVFLIRHLDAAVKGHPKLRGR